MEAEGIERSLGIIDDVMVDLWLGDSVVCRICQTFVRDFEPDYGLSLVETSVCHLRTHSPFLVARVRDAIDRWTS